MATQFFGQFLLEKRAITREQLLDASKYQKQIELPLCAMAIGSGCLSDENLSALDADCAPPDAEYLAAAVRRNMITFDQLQKLSRDRTERWEFLGEALAARGYLPLLALKTLLAEYRQVNPPPAEDMLEWLMAVPGDRREIVSSFLDVTTDLLLHYTRQLVEVLRIKREANESDDITYVFSQKVTGDREFRYALALPEDLTLSVASQMLQEENVEINALVLDAVSEFVNIVVGNGCTKLNMRNARVTTEPPQALKQDMLDTILPDDVVNVRLKAAGGEFDVLFLFSDSALDTGTLV